MTDFNKQLKVRLISILGWLVIQFIGCSCRIKTVGYDQAKDVMKSGKGVIMALWHGRTMLPVYYCRGLGVWAITSLSRDGEIQTGVVSRFGYRIIRGSSGRGGMKAALIASKKLQEGGVLSITPDGPGGPPNEVQDGTIFLAERAGCAIIPVGVGASRFKVIPRTWDSYTVPLPFSRVVIYFGSPIMLSEIGEQGDAKSIVKAAIDECQLKAEELVKEGR